MYRSDCVNCSSDTNVLDSFNSDRKNDAGAKAKRRRATICTTYCKFEIVRKTARSLGMKDVPYNDAWNVLWTDYAISVAKIKALKGCQRVNHFPGMAEICHKALLAKNLNRMAKHFPKQYSFFPKTWCFPSEYNDALDYCKKHVGRTYILKPGAGCRGQGIQLTKNFRSLPPGDKLICQIYISKPFLVDGLKFDLRVYTLVTSCDPLRIYVYNEGLARFATAPYRKPAGYNLANCYMHLTNYSVNKYSSTYVSDGECGTKRRLSCLNQWLNRNLYDADEIWFKIDEVIVKTIISALPAIKHNYKVCFPNHNVLPACFEILGFDILLDNNLNPFVLEVNHSPSFNTDSKVDEEIKLALLEDTFKLLNLAEMDTQSIAEHEKRRTQIITNTQTKLMQFSDLEKRMKQPDWIEGDKGNYRLVYPVKARKSMECPYKEFLDVAFNISFMVPDNSVSRAKEQANKMQRDHVDQALKAHLSTNKQPAQTQLVNVPNVESNTQKVMISNISLCKSINSQLNLIRDKVKADSNFQMLDKEDEKTSTVDENTEENVKCDLNFENIDDNDNDNDKDDISLNVAKINLLENEKENFKDQEGNNQSSMNLINAYDEGSKEEIPTDDIGSEFYVRKLYKKLQESGHMASAKENNETTQDSGDNKPEEKQENLSKDITPTKSEEEKLLSKSGKVAGENPPKQFTLDNEINEIINKAERMKRRAIKRSELLSREEKQSANSFTELFHSKAASEFLKFQRIKLLRKFQDLI